jgi:hypothetical protein
MNLLETILQAQGGGAVRQMAQQFGIGEDQAQSAIGAVLPMLAGAMQQNVQGGGLEGLLGALQGGGHEKYLDDPNALFSQEAVQDGNGILGHLLGGKEVSRQLASHASAQSGVGSEIIKQMLPMVAGLLMGGMSRQANSSGLLGQVLGAAMGGGGGGMGGGGMGGMIGSVLGSMMGGGGAQPQQQQAAPAASGILGMLGPLMDQNQNGSALDDILGMAGKFLSRR